MFLTPDIFKIQLWLVAMVNSILCFWDSDLHLSKTGYLKFASSLFNWVSLCNTSRNHFCYYRNPTSTFQPRKTCIMIYEYTYKPKYIHKSFLYCLHVHEVSVSVPVMSFALFSPFYFSHNKLTNFSFCIYNFCSHLTI